MMPRVFWICILLRLALVPSLAGVKNSDCLDCHGDHTLVKTNAAGQAVSLFVDAARLKLSVHRTNDCVSCHGDVTARHPDDNRAVAVVNCGRCHARAMASFASSVHGLALRAGQADAATCKDCHDTHSVVPETSAASSIHCEPSTPSHAATPDSERALAVTAPVKPGLSPSCALPSSFAETLGAETFNVA